MDLFAMQQKVQDYDRLLKVNAEQKKLLREAQRLMLGMHAKCSELQRDKSNLLMALRAVHNSFWFFALPRVIRMWIKSWMKREPF